MKNGRTAATRAPSETGAARLPSPPDELRRFVQLLSYASPSEGSERRASRRYATCTNVVCIPLDSGMRQCNEPFVGVMRDISVEGISIFHVRPVPSKFVVVTIGESGHDSVWLVFKVLRCRRRKKFFELSGKLVYRVKPETVEQLSSKAKETAPAAKDGHEAERHPPQSVLSAIARLS